MCDYLRNQVVGSRSIEMIPHGILDFRRGTHELVFLSQQNEDVKFLDHPLTHVHDLCYEFSPDVSRLCILGDRGNEVFFFDAKQPGFLTSHMLERGVGDDPGFMKTHLCRRGSRFILVYESGVLCLDDDGELLWSIPGVTYSWGLQEVSDKLLTLYDENARNRSFSIIDGNEVSDVI